MNVIDAYLLVESYVDAVAREIRPGEPFKRASTLPASKEQIMAAYKLYAAHVLFWTSIPADEFKDCIFLLNFLGSFCDDASISRFVEINNLLNTKNPFRKIRRPEIRAELESEKKQLLDAMMASRRDLRQYYRAINEFIATIQPLITKTKQELASKIESISAADFGNEIGNFVCDIYEIANIERGMNDTEYFWPFRYLSELSENKKFDYLFAGYKIWIASACYRYDGQE